MVQFRINDIINKPSFENNKNDKSIFYVFKEKKENGIIKKININNINVNLINKFNSSKYEEIKYGNGTHSSFLDEINISVFDSKNEE